jgi:prefoldin subunit 5
MLLAFKSTRFVYGLLRIFALIAFLGLSSVAIAQEATESELINEFNHLSQTMAYLDAVKSKIDLVESQKTQLEKFRADMREMADLSGSLAGGEDGLSAESLSMLLEKNRSLYARLTDEILLPHQADLLKKEVFKGYVRFSGGNAVQAFLQFSRDFSITKDQRQKLNSLNESVSKKLKEAQEEFQKKAAQIRDEAQRELDTLLSDEQKSKLRALMPDDEKSKR